MLRHNDSTSAGGDSATPRAPAARFRRPRNVLTSSEPMSVASHLRIDLAEYDRRIRTFIPHYASMLAAVAAAIDLAPGRHPLVVDLGIGTGALAFRCLATRPGATVLGVDSDPAILEYARRRLVRRWPRRVTLTSGDFARIPLPRCDALVATLALHHVPTARAKQRLYAKCQAALRPGGVLASGDCFPARDPALARRSMERWRAHMRRTYDARATRRYFRAWAEEDTYFSLADEWTMLERAGFRVDVPWRQPPFGVVVARKP